VLYVCSPSEVVLELQALSFVEGKQNQKQKIKLNISVRKLNSKTRFGLLTFGSKTLMKLV
jgi:hypothetical protein